MTNPFQYPSGFQPDPSGPMQRHSSYAGSNAYPARASAFAQILNPVSDDLGRGLDREPGSDSHGYGGHSRSWSLRLGHTLPAKSRVFNSILSSAAESSGGGSGYGAGGGGAGGGFFTPSYLKGSTYVQRLEEAHHARLAAQRDGQQPIAAHGGVVASSSSSVSSHPKPASHRGMTFDLVEKPPAPEDEATMNQLPSRWNRADRALGLELLADGQEVKYSSPRNGGEHNHEACSVRADHFMPQECGIYYFEITILTAKPDDTWIGIGFSGKSAALTRQPGWEPESWGYHSDDGRCFASQNTGKSYGPKYSVGDVIGCGVNFRTGSAFFTKNGVEIGTAFRDVRGKLYPSIGMRKTGEHVRANFGQQPFVFDIDSVVKAEKRRVWDEIKKTDTSQLQPGMNENELIQKLVLQFLQHEGYVETARAFGEEIHKQDEDLTLDPNTKVPDINIRDDVDAHNRQRIRRAILDGDIDKAIKYTNLHYPQVLKDNEQVYFRLRCRKFIEMMRREAEANNHAEPKRATNGFSTGGTAEMEVDETTGWDNMDTEDGLDVRMAGEAAADEDLTLSALAFGQELQEEFKDDPRREVAQALKDIFAIWAYPDPLHEESVAHLLDSKGRVAVAEEVNSAILSSLGKSSRSALETMYAQTVVLLDDLREDGGSAAFVSVEDVFSQIPGRNSSQ